MNNLKFRAWDIEKKKMRHVYSISITRDGISAIVRNDNPPYNKFLRPDQVIVMQYTGLQDKNGKGIWEGDINADYENKRSEVVFYAGGFYLKYSKTKYTPIGATTAFNRNVIGNLYENAGLIKQ